MRILVTGASGRVGRAIYVRLCAEHDVLGLDVAPSSTADRIASLAEEEKIRDALRGVDAVVHTAALHAPHVGRVADHRFESTNVQGTATLARLAVEAGARRFVFTSTTALYGAASTLADRATWITEETPPLPETIYHRTKLAAERLLERIADDGAMSVTILRISRCFPEPAPIMAVYRLHRGIDARDVAEAHAAALGIAASGCRRYVVSGETPFLPEDASELRAYAPAVLARRAPGLVEALRQRGWAVPASIDRVYCPARAAIELGWRARYGYEEVLAELDRRSSEVLPPRAHRSAGE